MKIANARLTLSHGNDAPVYGITPAEAMILVRRFSFRAGGVPLTELEEVGELPRTNIEEARRLRAKYGRDIVDKMYPGVDPRMPETFEAAMVLDSDNAKEDYEKGAVFFGNAADVAAAIEKAKKEQ